MASKSNKIWLKRYHCTSNHIKMTRSIMKNFPMKHKMNEEMDRMADLVQDGARCCNTGSTSTRVSGTKLPNQNQWRASMCSISYIVIDRTRIKIMLEIKISQRRNLWKNWLAVFWGFKYCLSKCALTTGAQKHFRVQRKGRIWIKGWMLPIRMRWYWRYSPFPHVQQPAWIYQNELRSMPTDMFLLRYKTQQSFWSF